MKLGCAVHVEHIVHEFQPLDTVQGLCLHTQPMKIIQQVILDVVEPGLDLRHAFTLHTEGDELGLGQTIIALGKLLAQHLRILRTHIIETVFLERNADALFKLGAVGCHVHKGQFKFDGAVEKVEEGTPFLENRRLILLLGELIIDVLILDGAGVIVGLHPAGASSNIRCMGMDCWAVRGTTGFAFCLRFCADCGLLCLPVFSKTGS